MSSQLKCEIADVSAGASKMTGADVRIEVTLRNASLHHRLRVNVRGMLASATSPNAVRDLWFEITDKTRDERIDFDCRIRGGAASASEYSTLEPGQGVKFVHTLRCFQLPSKGTFDVTAHIDVPVPKEMVTPGTRSPVVPVRSNTISFTMGG